jgi:hypothetical protein
MKLGHDEEALPARAELSITEGELPAFEPPQTLGGLGDGRPCAVCGRVARDRDVAFTLEWPGRPVLHAACYLAWRRALRARERRGSWQRLLDVVRTARSIH